MKTALQELIDWCISNAFNIEGQDGTRYIAIDYEEMRENFDNLLSKEREQIETAHSAGLRNKWGEEGMPRTGEQYFKETHLRQEDVKTDPKRDCDHYYLPYGGSYSPQGQMKCQDCGKVIGS